MAIPTTTPWIYPVSPRWVTKETYRFHTTLVVTTVFTLILVGTLDLLEGLPIWPLVVLVGVVVTFIILMQQAVWRRQQSTFAYYLTDSDMNIRQFFNLHTKEHAIPYSEMTEVSVSQGYLNEKMGLAAVVILLKGGSFLNNYTEKNGDLMGLAGKTIKIPGMSPEMAAELKKKIEAKIRR